MKWRLTLVGPVTVLFGLEEATDPGLLPPEDVE